MVYFGTLRLPATPYLNVEPTEHDIRGMESGIIASLRSDPAAGVVYSPIPHVSWDERRADIRWRHDRSVKRFLLENHDAQANLPGGLTYMMKKSK
jgi:hypothetical protein